MSCHIIVIELPPAIWWFIKPIHELLLGALINNYIAIATAKVKVKKHTKGRFSPIQHSATHFGKQKSTNARYRVTQLLHWRKAQKTRPIWTETKTWMDRERRLPMKRSQPHLTAVLEVVNSNRALHSRPRLSTHREPSPLYTTLPEKQNYAVEQFMCASDLSSINIIISWSSRGHQ